MKTKLFISFIFIGCAALSSAQAPTAATPAPGSPCPTGPGNTDQPALCVPAAAGKLPAAGDATQPNGAAAAPGKDRPEENIPPALAATRVVGPITIKSDFEIFAEDEAGRTLPVYGRQFFDSVPTTFAPLSDAPVPADYVLGPGDQLQIRTWGKIDLDTRVTVDRNGEIFVPRIGSLRVAGLRYEQVEGFVRSAIAALYKDFELNVAIGKLRSIQVFVLGSARQPGVYTLGSLSTLVDALFACGGPSATGSMRRIELRRGNRLVTRLDLYEMLRRGDKSHDAALLPGDVIYIPPAGPQVAVMGSVNLPGIYELTEASSVESTLEDAGGLTSLASVDRILLERIDHRSVRRVEEFQLDESGLRHSLGDGDILRVFPLSPRFENAVTLRGNVAQSGRYLWREGMRISDLIPTRDFLLNRDYWNQQNHLTPERAGDPFTAAPEAVTPDQTRIVDAPRNSDEINWNYAAIERLNDSDLKTDLLAFNLGNAIDRPDSHDNLVLKPGDVITISSQKDIPMPVESRATFVRIEGEVNAPGLYRVEPGETLRALVQRAGGLMPKAYLYAAVLTRVSARLAQEAELRLSAEQTSRELAARYAAAPAQSTAANTTPTEMQAQYASQKDLIATLAAIHPTGRVVLGVEPEAKTVEDIPEFPLEDGDNFFIPFRQNTVQVSGAVYNGNSFRYERGKRVAGYLNDAGGPTRQADSRRIFIIRADGTVVSRQSHSQFWRTDFERLALLPGDSVVVPQRINAPGGFLQQMLAETVSQAGIIAAVISTAH
jgi:protein involved in polysaccharide export with SLBB domain